MLPQSNGGKGTLVKIKLKKSKKRSNNKLLRDFWII